MFEAHKEHLQPCHQTQSCINCHEMLHVTKGFFPHLHRSLGTTGNQVVGSSSPSSPRLSDKQEPVSVTSPAPKLTIKNEPLKRTVVAQTVSTTVVHVSVTFHGKTCTNAKPLN